MQIHADFEIAFKKSENLFETNWLTVAQKIIRLAQSLKRDKEIKKQLENYTNGLLIFRFQINIIKIFFIYSIFQNQLTILH